MKYSKLIAASLLALYFGNSHSAVHLSSSKTGSAIIVPFYTVSNQMNTLLSLNNTTDENKAVKIHFKEAKSGDILTSFNVYLTGQDMWTMATGQVIGTGGGQIRMITDDQSCTIGFPDNEEIPVDEDWLWENGTIEIIEMGTVGNIDELQTPDTNCEAIENLWKDDEIWAINSEDQLTAATGGLHAEVTLMDVEQGHSANLPIIHMDGFYGEDNIQHTPAGDEFPNLSTGSKDSLVMTDGQVIETTWPTGFEAVSALLVHNTLINEFNLEYGVGGKTEWIISFPTIKYYDLSENNVIKPFVDELLSPHYFGYALNYYDRESELIQFVYGCPISAPCPPPIEINIIEHSVQNLIIGRYWENINLIEKILTSSDNNTESLFFPSPSPDFESGKIQVNFSPEHSLSTINDRGNDTNNAEINHKFYGLPVVGFAYTRFTNAAAQPGLLAQYAFVREHFGEKKITVNE